ncbi:hypothetical protein WG954_19590 [Lacibacter sp. H375]|uniref:hypothetical protein n=1 Tax=Lacibacter sp. H375 TaxID=3133424 RepID=UPI0030BF56AF
MRCIYYQWNEIKMVEHLAKAPQVPAVLLYFNGCSIDQQVYAVCYSGITCNALREEANTQNLRLILAPTLLYLDRTGGRGKY